MNAIIERLPHLPVGEVKARLAIPPAITERLFPRRLCDIPQIPPPMPPVGRSPYRLGCALWDDNVEFLYHPVYTDVHAAVFGESGSGKSKLLELLGRRLLLDGEGMMVVDPDKDLVDNLLAFVAHRWRIGDRALARRCHVLTIEDDLAFRFDPFTLLPPRRSLPSAVYQSRLRVLADRLLRQIQRGLSDEDLAVMNRLKKRLRGVIMACGVDYDGKGTHLGLDKAVILANPSDPEFRTLLDLVYPHLPRPAQMTFREVMREGNEKIPPAVLDHWESTQNKIDDFLSPLVALCLGTGSSVDFARGVANREVFFVRIGQNSTVSHDMAVTMAGFLFDAYLQVKEGEENLPPHLRTPATLIVDEAGDFIGPDLCRALRKDRKLKLRIVLGAQNYLTLCNSNLEMGGYVLSQCGTIFAFAQRLGSAGREEVADRIFTGNLRCTPRFVEVQLQRGWLQTTTVDASVGGNTAKTWNETEAKGRTKAESKTRARQRALVVTEGQTDGEAEAFSHSDNFGSSDSFGSSMSHIESPIIVDGMIIGNAPVLGTGSSSGHSNQSGHSNKFSMTHNRAHSRSRSETDGTTNGTGHSVALSRTSATGKGGSDGESWTMSMKTSLMPNVVSEWRWDGSFEEGAVADQRAIWHRWLHSLKTAECFVSVLNIPEAFPVRIDQVTEKWETPDLKWAAVRLITRLVAAQHGYTFSPSVVPDKPIIAERRPLPLAAPRRADGFND